MNTLLEAANWLNKGIAVIPIWFRDKRPAIFWKKYQSRLPEYSELLQWFKQPRNLAIITGWRNLTVLDFDKWELYLLWAAQYGKNTYQVKTARGVHVYFFIEQAPEVKHLPGIDIKMGGGYVIAPPSIHPSGAEYRVFADHPIMGIEKIEDVIPASWFPVVRPIEPRPKFDIAQYDPWQAASNPIVSGNGSVDRIRERMRIEDFFPDRISTGNGKFIARCPFHNDNNPSMWLDTERQMCGCFAGCTPKALDVINLYAKLNNVDNTTAIFEMSRIV